MRLVHVVEVVLIIRLARTSAFSRQGINMTTTDERNSNISEFLKPIKFGRRSLWLKSEVEQWLMQKIEESREEVSA